MHTIKLKIAKAIFNDGRTFGNILPPDFKLYYTDIVIKIAFFNNYNKLIKTKYMRVIKSSLVIHIMAGK